MSSRPSLRRATTLLLAVAIAACGGKHRLVSRAPGAKSSCVIRNVRVFDAPNARLLDGPRDVVVRDGRIAEVAAPGAAAAGLAEIDGRGGTLLPGLVDVHTHTGGVASPTWHTELPDAEQNLSAFLYAGVTTVLDAGGLTPAIFRLRDQVRSREVLGPHLYAAGPMFTSPNGHPVGLMRANLPFWIRWYILPRIARELAAVDAIGAGVDALMHDVYAEPITDEAVARIAAAHLPVVATIGIWDAVERMGTLRPEAVTRLTREVAEHAVLEALAAFPSDAERERLTAMSKPLREAHAARRANVAKLRAAGVVILAGSDAVNAGQFPGASLHDELADLVEAGMTPGEVLRAATYENARFLGGADADFGAVAPRQRADLLLIDGDPTSDIGATQRIAKVWLDGVGLDRHAR